MSRGGESAHALPASCTSTTSTAIRRCVLPLARTAGADLTGLNWVQLPAGEEGALRTPLGRRGDLRRARRCRQLELWPSPQRARAGIAYEETPIRAGHVIRARPSGIAHGFRAGEGGMTFLAYGTRNANDVCYYPRSNKIYFRGLGLIARLDDLEYADGEPG